MYMIKVIKPHAHSGLSSMVEVTAVNAPASQSNIFQIFGIASQLARFAPNLNRK